jgi:hypothetical protein
MLTYTLKLKCLLNTLSLQHSTEELTGQNRGGMLLRLSITGIRAATVAKV